MGIFNFFKRKKIREPEPILEKITFNKIPNWLSGKTEEIKEKEKEIFDSIKEKINVFLPELDAKIKVLESIDIESKKVEGRVKIIVKQGLDKYLSHVHVFTKELGDSKKHELEQFIKDIDKIFSSFHKHSNVFYHRANYLIGDEIAAVKQEIVDLSKYFIKLFNDTEKTINSLRKISSIKSELNRLNSTEITLDKIDSEIKSLAEKMRDSKEKEKRVLQEINNIKMSKDHMENLKKQEEIKSVEKQLEESIWKLKELIDFKALSNFFHSYGKEMNIIKDYKENFRMALRKNNGDDISKLLSESDIGSNIILNKIKEINEEKQKILKDKELIKNDKTKILFEEIQKVKYEIESLNIEKVKHKRRYDNIEKTKEDILESISREVKNLGAIITTT